MEFCFGEHYCSGLVGLELFEADLDTEGIVLIGEIGGQMENEAAQWAKQNVTKIAMISNK